MVSIFRRLVVVLGLAGAAAASGVFLAGCSGKAESTPPAAGVTRVAPKSPERKRLVRVIEQPGAVHAYEETLMYARVSGFVGKVRVDIGARIDGPNPDGKDEEAKLGQVLAEIAVPELEQETKQKQALVRQTLAEVEQAKKALAAAAAAITTAESAVVEAKALEERWASEFKRVTKLVDSGTLDRQAGDETQHQYKAAAARVGAADAAVVKVKADRDKAAADVKAMEARVDVAKAEAGRAEAMLAYSKIRAPYNGVVTARRVNTGDLVQPTTAKGDWLFTVARLDPARVVVAVPEADASLIEDNLEVKLSIPALSGPDVSGKIARTSKSLERAARTLRVEVDIPNKDGRLRPGMYVYARIYSRCPENWTLPAAALVKQGDGMVCFRIEGGKAMHTPVQVGRSDGTFTEALKWQKAGSTSWEDWTGKEVVAGRAAGLVDGQVVELEK